MRIKIAVDIVHCGKTNPLGIVTEALKRAKDYDYVYCVIDRDTHERWEEAHNAAKGKANVEIIASYPCFEYWLILHFRESTKPYARAGNNSPGDCCVADLRRIDEMQTYQKGAKANLFAELHARLKTARSRARRLFEEAKQSGQFNPSTTMYLLVEEFEKVEELLDA